jgi:restriction endonuclease S subunit
MPPFALKIDASFSTETKSKQNIMASVEAFKSAVIRIRDIFRGLTPSITGMESMRHLCLYLMSRYITKDKVKSLGIPDEFAWDNLIETAQTKNGGVQKALDLFFHKESDCLVNYFDRLFGTRDFSFDIKNPAKHKEILELLSNKDIDIKNIDLNMDILGWVYEQHLGKGSGGSAMRDLGQFFTDRFICDYMVALCKPDFKSKGIPESVCDPSMGTGGFLTSYMKFYKKNHQNKPVDWSIQNKEIHGCDTDQKVAGVARLNLFMESGGSVASNLLLRNSLNEDLIQTGYDLILANMPFGLKGIKHAECCERVKDLKIRGTKSEPLFLQLMMVSLNRGGRCAVVVPDGMLVNGSTCHDETRKYLLDNFELKRVIKMKGQFFMNTGIQPSILFFENTGKSTSVVEFWDVIKGVNGDIEETMVLSVPRAKFDASCSFDMRRYQEVKAVANPAGFPMVKLGDLYEVPKVIKKFNSGDMNNRGDSAFFNGKWDCPVGNHSEHSFTSDKEYFVLIKDGGGDHSSSTVGMGKFFKVKGKCSITSHNVILVQKKDNDITHHYVYYYMMLNVKSLRDKARYSINLGSISMGDIMDFPISLPPLETQQEIVATLDRIYAPGTTELAETLKLTDKAMGLVLANPGGASLEPIVEAQRLMRKSAQMVADVKAQMVADVKAQMVAIMRSVGHRGFPSVKLSDVCNDVSTNKNIPSSERKDGEFRFFTCSRDYSTHNESHYNGTYLIHGSRGSTISESVFATDNEKFAIGTSMFLSEVKDKMKVELQYLYYYFKCNREIVDTRVNSSAIPMISKTVYYTIEVILPPIEFQREILQRLNALQTQLTSLENLGKQAEDNARFILDSYLNTA